MEKLAILFVLCLSTIGLCGPTGWTWYEYNGHEYALTNVQSSWAGAEQEAISAGGHLVTINDYEENLFVGDTFDDFSTGNYLIGWIGLTGSTSNNAWASGEPVTFTTFAGGYGVNTGQHFYMHLFSSSGYNWNNHVLHDTGNTRYNCLGIIELDGTSTVPVPGSIFLVATGLLSLRRKFKRYTRS